MTVVVGQMESLLSLNAKQFVEGLERARAVAQSNIGKINRTMSTLESGAKLASRAMASIGIAVAGIGARELIRVADNYKMLQARVQNVTAATGDYIGVSKELNSIATQTGIALEDTAKTFQGISIGAKELGKSNKDVLDLTRTVQQLGVLSGASGEAMKNSTLQFGQAMAGGILRAEEFNSIMENTPLLGQKIAEGMGLTVGQLRQAVLAGNVLSKDVFESLSGQSKKIAEDFAKMPSTFEKAMNQFSISTSTAIGEIDLATGATDLFAGALQGISKYIADNTQNIATFSTYAVAVFKNLFGSVIDGIGDAFNAGGKLFMTLAGWVGQNQDLILISTQRIGNAFSLVFNGVLGIFSGGLAMMSETLKNAIDGVNFLGSSISGLYGQMRKVANFLPEMGKVGVVGNPFGDIQKTLEGFSARRFKAAGNAWNNLSAPVIKVKAPVFKGSAFVSDFGGMASDFGGDDKKKKGKKHKGHKEKLTEAQKEAKRYTEELKRWAEGLNGILSEAAKGVNFDFYHEGLKKANDSLKQGIINTQTYTQVLTAFDEKMLQAIASNSQLQEDKKNAFESLAKGTLGSNMDTFFDKLKEDGETLMQQAKSTSDYISDLWESTRTPMEKYTEKLAEINSFASAGFLDADLQKRAIDKAKTDFLDVKNPLDELTNAARNWGKTFEDSFIASIRNGKLEFKDMAASILEDISRIVLRLMVIEPLAARISAAIKGQQAAATGGGGWGGILGTVFKGITGAFGGGSGGIPTAVSLPSQIPMFAEGGIMQPNKLSIVGEKGPELIMPTSSARVFSNSDSQALLSGGGGSVQNVTQNFYIQATDVQTFADQLKRQAGMIKSIAISAVDTKQYRLGQA